MNLSNPLVHAALEIALFAHKDQTRYNGIPYIIHPLRVAEEVEGRGYDDVTVAAALLHDMVEDSNVGLSQLKEFGMEGDIVIDLVDALTRRDGESYEDFISRVIAYSSSRTTPPRAVIIKLADIHDNLYGPDAAPSPKKRGSYLMTETRLSDFLNLRY